MKKILTILVAAFTCCATAETSRGVDVDITITVSKSGGTNYLNTKTKLKEGGEMRYTLTGEPETVIQHAYNIIVDKKNNYILSVVLTKKQLGSKDKQWSEDIPISKDGKTVFHPFKKVEMKVEIKTLGIPA